MHRYRGVTRSLCNTDFVSIGNRPPIHIEFSLTAAFAFTLFFPHCYACMLKSFSKRQDGNMGAAEACGRIKLFDLLVSVNGEESLYGQS